MCAHNNPMIARRLLLLPLLAALVALIPAPAKATTETVDLTGVSGGIQGGMYTSPYYASINGSTNTTSVICDSYVNTSYLNKPWTATVSSFADLSSTKMDSTLLFNSSTVPGLTANQQMQGYLKIGWLVEQLLKPANAGHSGDISFAIWAIFDPSVTKQPGWTSGANSWLTQANSQKNLTASQFSNLAILTPVGTPLGGTPQEFIAVLTPEPSSFLLLGLGLMATAMFLYRKNSGLSAPSSPLK
jgi:PEP-CTERM motif-containing protein